MLPYNLLLSPAEMIASYCQVFAAMFCLGLLRTKISAPYEKAGRVCFGGYVRFFGSHVCGVHLGRTGRLDYSTRDGRGCVVPGSLAAGWGKRLAGSSSRSLRFPLLGHEVWHMCG